MEQLAALVGAAREAASGAPGARHPLSASAIAQLERQGCTCADWSRVTLAAHSSASAAHATLSRVRDCHLAGRVSFGQLHGLAADGLPGAVARCFLEDVWLEDDVRVVDCGRVRRCWLGRGAVAARCVALTGSGGTSFGVGSAVPVAIGSGGRDVLLRPDLSLEEACRAAVNRDAESVARHAALATAAAKRLQCPWSVVAPGARLEGVLRALDVLVGEAARVEGGVLEEVTLVSSAEEPCEVVGGSDVRVAVLQHGASVDGMSVVSNALMCPCSHVERHGKLLDAVLGPYSGVAEGEVSESLVGPFVGFHHQALLIASYWPAGRGNVGYGANVGSNHTGKAPDQELWHGEGVFYGLGCCVKFPSNFTRAPYSLIATGVTTLPQKVDFPFSLISSASRARDGISPAFNEISPAWVLAQNVYSVLRNEHKFRARGGKSPRVSVDARVFRPATVAMMRAARDLLAAPHPPAKELYTDKDFTGLGKNVMTHAARLEAVEAYTFYLLHYAALQGLWPRVARGESMAALQHDIDAAPAVAAAEPQEDLTLTGLERPSAAAEAAEWRLQCAILKAEGPALAGSAGVAALLAWLKGARAQVAQSARKSKQKDELRGEKIIPGYRQAHGDVATTDKVVLRVQAEADELAAAIDRALASSSSSSSSSRGRAKL